MESAVLLPFPAKIVSMIRIHPGGYTDLWIVQTEHYCNTNADRKAYVIKVVRCVPTDTVQVEIITAALRRMISVWFVLDPNKVAPFLGLLRMDNGLPAIIQPYYGNGNIAEFLRAHPDADKLLLIKGLVTAVKYLHGRNVDHGNICMKAFLVTDEKEVVVSDPGFHHALQSATHNNSHVISSEWECKPREELDPTAPIDLRPTRAKDVYSVACVIFEICGGRVPGYRWPCRGIMYIINNGHIAMQRPTYINTALWGILQLCWDRTAATRPTMDEVDAAILQLASVD